MTIAPAQAPPERLRYTPRVPEGNPLLGGSNARRSELLLGCRELWRHSGAHARTECSDGTRAPPEGARRLT